MTDNLLFICFLTVVSTVFSLVAAGPIVKPGLKSTTSTMGRAPLKSLPQNVKKTTGSLSFLGFVSIISKIFVSSTIVCQSQSYCVILIQGGTIKSS